jgi:hypothetical protein
VSLDSAELALGPQQARHTPPPPHVAVTPPSHPRCDTTRHAQRRLDWVGGETMTHDYKRNGTTTLFAALDMLEGRLIGQCMPRHRHQEFIKFLKQIDAETSPDLDLHLMVDNYATQGQIRCQEPFSISIIGS